MILNYEKSTYYCKHATKIESRINYRTIAKYHTRLPSRKSNDLTCFTRALHYTANSRLCIRGSVSNCSSCWEQRSRSRISLFPSKQPLSNSNFSRGRVPPLAATSLRRNSWDWMGRSLGSNQSVVTTQSVITRERLTLLWVIIFRSKSLCTYSREGKAWVCIIQLVRK